MNDAFFPASLAYSGKRWTEREVRRLLKLLKRPHELAGFPLAQVIADALGVDDTFAAATRIIAETFENRGYIGRRLYELILKCDIEGTATQTATASDMGLSPRQFFRYRSEGVRAIAGHINRLLDQPGEDVHPLDALARVVQSHDPHTSTQIYELHPSPATARYRAQALLDAGTLLNAAPPGQTDSTVDVLHRIRLAMAEEIEGRRDVASSIVQDVQSKIFDRIIDDRREIEFEIALVRYTMARHDGRAFAIEQAALSLRDAAQTDDGLALQALSAEAEAAIIGGKLETARELLRVLALRGWEDKNPRLLSLYAYLTGQLAYCSGATATAHDLVQGATLASQTRPAIAAAFGITLDRIRIQMGLPQHPNAFVTAPRSFLALQAKGNKARFALMNGDTSGAIALSEDVLSISNASGMLGVGAWANATLASAYHTMHDERRAQRFGLAAIQKLFQTGDYFLLQDLFMTPGSRLALPGVLALNAEFHGVLVDELAIAYPSCDLVADRHIAALFVDILIEAVLAATDNLLTVDTSKWDRLADHLKAGRIRISNTHRHFRAVTTHVATFVAAVLPVDGRARFRDRFGEILRRLQETIINSDRSMGKASGE